MLYRNIFTGDLCRKEEVTEMEDFVDVAEYLVITQWDRADANINYETDDLEDAKETARILSKDDPKDAHTFVVKRVEWEDGNYEEIEF